MINIPIYSIFKGNVLMRKNHTIGGLAVFAVGLFLLYLYGPYALELIKGAMQPVLILIGLISLAAGFMGKKEQKKMNFIVAAVFLLLGLYGLYDEYYAVVDFFNGLFPPLLIVVGLISIFHGIKNLA